MPPARLPPVVISMCFELGGALDEARDALALALGDQRPDLVLVVVVAAVADGRDGGGEVGDELVVDLAAGIDAAGGGAVLPGIVVAEDAHALDDGVDVGIVEDDDRRLAAELEMGALDRLRRRGQHLLAGGDVAGERDHRRPSDG